MALEPILFHKGLNGEARSCLTPPGHLRRAQNISFEVDGTQALRPRFESVNVTALDAIHSTKNFKSALFTGSAGLLSGNHGLGDFTSLFYSSASLTKPWFWSTYKDFLMGVDQTDFILCDTDLNVYNARIDNPTTSPSGSAGAAGNPNGHYFLYVSYLITFPNGHMYETGLSPVSADVSVINQIVSWTNIPICPYIVLHGVVPSIHRRLYRGPGTGGTIADIYYVATITDNSTTTYSDDLSDVALQASDVCYVDLYAPPPISKYVAAHYGRLYMIPYVNSHRLWYTEAAASLEQLENEALMPLAVQDTNWDDLRTAGFDELDPQGLVPWGVNLYIPLKDTWIRKQGNTPSTWSFKKTYASSGIGAPNTIAISSNPIGIVGLTNPVMGRPNLAIFTGQESQVFSSPKLDYILHRDIDLTLISQCYGRMSGPYYILIYPSIDGTNKVLGIDFRRFPDIRVAYWTNLYGQSMDADSHGIHTYFGGSDGIVRVDSDHEEVDVLIESEDFIGGVKEGANILKTYNQLKYSLKGSVTMEVYVDDVLMQWSDGSTSIVLTGTGEEIQLTPNFPQDCEGYRFRLVLTGSDLTELEIYSPWSLIYDPKM